MCGIRKGSAVLVLFFKPAVMSPKLDLWIPSPCGPYVTHNAIWPLEKTYEVICRFSGATEGFILLFHICCRTPKDLQTHLNVLICQSYLLILNFSSWNVKTQNLNYIFFTILLKMSVYPGLIVSLTVSLQSLFSVVLCP